MSKYLERTLASKPTFGDYVTLPMKCYGGPNEHFVHEVLSSPFISNSWREVPIKAGYFEEQLHDTSEPVVAVRTQGVNPRDAHIFAVRLADVLPMKGDKWSWRESPLRTRIAELEAAQRWIPVGERLPEAYEKVIALAKDCMNVDWVLPKELREVGKGAFARLYNVTHWMPLPEPPIVYGKECEE